jgi:hypothetical protein
MDQIATGSTGWQGLLEGSGVTIVVTGPTEVEFGSRLEAAGWSKAYADADGSVDVAPGRCA